MVGVPSPGDWLFLGLKANVESAGSTPSSASKAQPVVSFREAQGHARSAREGELCQDGAAHGRMMLKGELPLFPRCTEISLGSLKCPFLYGQEGVRLLLD
ncbi:unnamed protein product [Rangifer tarandus platyrhynchus]|uniref:Uncharacterized protein n=1 Tax=Rangifer tarandus platyrhynchus TaxID=3082113 RepID=A0AC59ZTQ1_RANTA